MATESSGSKQIQSLWNPFRDWNEETPIKIWIQDPIQSLWNPFRDWNLPTIAATARLIWFKASETLLGIETY